MTGSKYTFWYEAFVQLTVYNAAAQIRKMDNLRNGYLAVLFMEMGLRDMHYF